MTDHFDAWRRTDAPGVAIAFAAALLRTIHVFPCLFLSTSTCSRASLHAMQLRTWAWPVTCVVVFVAAFDPLAMLLLCFFFFSISASPPFSSQDMTHAPFKCWSVAELGLLLCFASFPSPQRGHLLGPSCCDSARAHASTKISDAQTG
jgi:hypothetical protein